MPEQNRAAAADVAHCTAYHYSSADDYAEAYGYNSADDYTAPRAAYNGENTGHHPSLCGDLCPCKTGSEPVPEREAG